MSIEICKELHQNFVDFAYESNSQRAFPDARDGLKPGQRACLWEFFSKGYSSSKPHVKSAKVSGGVIGSWWPHGDVAVYETFARMSQPWINNIPEVDWHGANGSQIGGPECASARYTEARLSKASEEGFFSNIKKKTVNMIPNFTEDDEWPELFPAIFPRLYVNGSQGIGLTIANVWVPGNLGEFVEKVKEYLEFDSIVNYDNIYPDFPSGGIIINKNELPNIYKTGRGKVILRAKTSIENNSILIHELPYQVYAEPLIDSIKDLVQEENIVIRDIYNKIDKKHILIEIECEKSPSVILNTLFAKTDLQKTFNPNQYALVSKVPQLLNLNDYVKLYIDHNLSCISKEYEFDYEKAKKRLEIVEGLIKAIVHIDDIIKLIKSSDSASNAIYKLMSTYNFTEKQATAITDMKRGRLAKLEGVELNKEAKELEEEISNCLEILNNKDKLTSIFLERLENFNKKFGYNRKTKVIQISTNKEDKEIEYVEPEKCVVIMRIPSSSFKTQKRNGKGIKTQDDITNAIIRTNTIDSLMIFSNKGKMYRLLVDEIPVGTNASKGVSVKSLVEMGSDEMPSTIYSIYRDTEAKYVLFATKNGLVKKTSLEEYCKTKKNGLAAITIRDDDELASVALVKDEPVVLVSKSGMAIKINSTDIGATGRVSMGVKGITLKENDEVIALLPVHNTESKLALFSVIGTGKKINLNELPIQNRGGKGLMCNKSGRDIAASCLVIDENDILIMGDTNSICISASEIPETTRGALGNQMIKGCKIISVSKV